MAVNLDDGIVTLILREILSIATDEIIGDSPDGDGSMADLLGLLSALLVHLDIDALLDETGDSPDVAVDDGPSGVTISLDNLNIVLFDQDIGRIDVINILGNNNDARIVHGGGDDIINSGDDANIVYAGAGDDTIDGGKGDDELNGERGADGVSGGTGRDRLDGGSGGDVVCGGLGADSLAGGAGRDRFQFESVRDSRATAADLITDFSGADRIDLSKIDADVSARGDQAFLFVGKAAFSEAAGELRYVIHDDGLTSILADIDGDGQRDLRIDLVGPTHLTAADFLL